MLLHWGAKNSQAPPVILTIVWSWPMSCEASSQPKDAAFVILHSTCQKKSPNYFFLSHFLGCVFLHVTPSSLSFQVAPTRNHYCISPSKPRQVPKNLILFPENFRPPKITKIPHQPFNEPLAMALSVPLPSSLSPFPGSPRPRVDGSEPLANGGHHRARLACSLGLMAVALRSRQARQVKTSFSWKKARSKVSLKAEDLDVDLPDLDLDPKALDSPPEMSFMIEELPSRNSSSLIIHHRLGSETQIPAVLKLVDAWPRQWRVDDRFWQRIWNTFSVLG